MLDDYPWTKNKKQKNEKKEPPRDQASVKREWSATHTSSVAWPLSPLSFILYPFRHSTFLTFLIEINALAFVLIKCYMELSAFHLPNSRKLQDSSFKPGYESFSVSLPPRPSTWNFLMKFHKLVIKIQHPDDQKYAQHLSPCRRGDKIERKF